MPDRREGARDQSIQLCVAEISPPGSDSILAKIIRWRDNFAEVAFGPETPFEPPVSDLDERLRQSEQKKRQLQSRINALLSRD